MKSDSDLNSKIRLHIRDGTSQSGRQSPALGEHYFELIDLRFHALMVMAVDYAEKIRFCNLNNHADGDWKSYFTADETVIIAMILATDTGKLVKLFKQKKYVVKHRQEAVRMLQAVLPAENRSQLIAVYCVAAMLDNWLVSLKSSRTRAGQELHYLIASVLAGLGNDLFMLISCLEQYLPEKSHDTFFSDDLIQLLALSRLEKKHALSDDLAYRTNLVAIRSNFQALLKAIEMLQARAADLLPATLHNRQHDPAAGLLIAFVQLFQRLQQKINRFTSNYIDFYYQQILGAQQLPFVPDHAYLVARLNNKKQRVLIPGGTAFSARQKGSQHELIYISEENTLVHGATVDAVHTLFFNRDPLNSPENALLEETALPDDSGKERRQLVTECRLDSLPILTEDTDNPWAYPVFGALKDTEADSVSVGHARIGFALASKNLLLKEGNRNIDVTLKFVDSDLPAEHKTLNHWIQEIAAALKSPHDNDSSTDFSREEEQDIFYKVFSNLFIISISAENGWMNVTEYDPAYSGVDDRLDENCLKITFTLPPDAPAVIAYSGPVHGEWFETQLPVIQFTLNPRGYLYPYGMLEKLLLEWIRIDVSVSGHRTLMLHNQLGQLSAETAFNPFGPLPEVGAYFLVGCQEATVKQLTHLSVDIQWSGLPTGIGGFKSYYQGYDGPHDHTDFKISKSVMAGNKWFPEHAEPAAVDTLFQIKNTSQTVDTLSEVCQLSCDVLLPYWNVSDYGQSVTETGYIPASRNGFFKFTLTEPADAFGHKKYPQILAQMLMHNARQRIVKKVKQEPHAPYTPLIDAIHVNYRAAARIPGQKLENNIPKAYQDQLIHLHPMGWEDAAMNSGVATALLPRYHFSGNLLIGLSGFESGGELSLYFYLRENALPSENMAGQQLHWFYLSSNQWVPLAARHIISDSTQRFMTSGIVTLDVPPDIDLNNTVMPDDLYWLRVSADYDLEKFCSLYAIYAQGIRVVRSVNNVENGDNHRVLFTPLPAGSIKQAKISIPGLDQVLQIQASAGGKSAEDKMVMRTRMSERLRHKNRTLLPEDYEQMILTYFPQIYKVKCFANLMPGYGARAQRCSSWICPGHVTIVLLPFPDKQMLHDRQLWVSGHLISEVRDFIKQYIPPFVSLHFVNPVYETIQIRCTVKLKNNRATGMLIGRLNEAISAYLSPWHDAEGYTTHFGWRISRQDVQSYIQQLDFIDRVTHFSIIRITPKGNALFDLTDSAAEARSSADFCEVTPKYPWSIAVPIRQHFIEVDDSFDMIEPEITGIGKLEIGSTFIVADPR